MMRVFVTMVGAVVLLAGACGGDEASAPPTATARPSSTPEIALTPAPIQSPPANFTPRPSPDVPFFEGVIGSIEIGNELWDYIETDDGQRYGIESLTPNLNLEISELAVARGRARLYGTLVQPVPDVQNRRIVVSRIERIDE
jgi:hypothetical protein